MIENVIHDHAPRKNYACFRNREHVLYTHILAGEGHKASRLRSVRVGRFVIFKRHGPYIYRTRQSTNVHPHTGETAIARRLIETFEFQQ
ncbi:hypothetical protein PILCRDRAFT_822347 [Piloderma croceum F 1598]|uniref:Uncharacterized protein n=1 Tax=Piloderma croceum (strain F 1598) TaxID=765440 RepID=A0A0C3BTI5_PILCF|nr:hypothetical protein PILCRDRAFT_822347 [Piloderma croceum F 1598]